MFLFLELCIPGKVVFAESGPKDSEAATWREKLDQLYKSSSQSFRVVVHGSKVRTVKLLCNYHHIFYNIPCICFNSHVA